MRSNGILPALAVAAITFTSSLPAYAQTASSTLAVTSTATCITAGASIPVTVALSGAKDVSTVQATITYDPTVFEVPSKPTIGASFPLPFRNETDPVKGRIELSASNSTAVNGSADFATITLHALKASATQIGFDQNASLVLTTTAENTNVLGTTTPLSLSACGGSNNGNVNSGFVNANTNGGSSNGNTNSGFVNVNTNSGSTSNTGNSGGGASQCAVPSEFAASGQASGIVMTWKYSDTRLTHFVVHYGRTQGTFDTVYESNNSNTLRDGTNFRLTLENVAPSKTYYVALSASGDCADSAMTETLSVQTAGTNGTGGTSAGGSSSTGGSSGGGNGSAYGSSLGGYDFSGSSGSTSVVNDGLTNKGAQFNYRLHGASGGPTTGPREAMMVAILSALAVAGMWVWRRGLV